MVLLVASLGAFTTIQAIIAMLFSSQFRTLSNTDTPERVSSSGGADVRLIFSGGTTQPLELEHNWSNYIAHGHPTNHAFSNCWIFAEENWNADHVMKLFRDLKREHNARIPDVFLCLENGQRKAYRANWETGTFSEVNLVFPTT